jgi:GAF domain-containing protein
MTETTVSKENIEKVRRELETMLDLAGQARVSIERALRATKRQDEQIKALRRSLDRQRLFG